MITAELFVALLVSYGCRYRGFVERVSPVEPKYDVYFIDFGNREKLSSERVRTIDAALAAVPAQARPACLAYLKVSCESTGICTTSVSSAVSCKVCMPDCMLGRPACLA